MEIILKANKREEFGRKVKRLRKAGILPANIYGKKVKSLAISVNLKEFEEVYKKAGETNLIYIQLNGEKRPALIHNVQKSPITDEYLHVDFLQVDLKEKVTAQVPIVLLGESQAEKQGIGTVVQYVSEVEVEAYPGEIPESFEVDKGKLLNVGDQITVGELAFDASKVEIKTDPSTVILKLEELAKEEEVKPEEAVPEEEAPTAEPEESPQQEEGDKS